MITEIEARGFRGLGEAHITGLSRLTVITGRNASGKSSLLEAALLGASRYPGEAAGRIVQLRGFEHGARWAIRKGEERLGALIAVRFRDGLRVEREVFWDRFLAVDGISRALVNRGAAGPYSAFRIYRREPPMPSGSIPEFGDRQPFSVVGFAANNDYEAANVEGRDLRGADVFLVKPSAGVSLHDGFSRSVQGGTRQRIVELVRAILPELQSIDVLTENGTPWLALTVAGVAVPASMAGDGVQAILQMAFELARPSGAIILLEEPEVHQHPGGLRLAAKVILDAVRGGVQVILSTHSLELVDALLATLSPEEVDDPSLVALLRVRLPTDGRLLVSHNTAAEAVSARAEISEDLR
ncbi:MAG: AAA family ATPase [Polyangiaceae bacterium]